MNSAKRIIAAIGVVALVFAGAAGALLLADRDGGPSPQSVQAYEHVDDRGISVQGEGQISVTPDVAKVVLGVEVEGSDLEALREDADSRMNDVVDVLQDMDIDEGDIQTITYDIRVQDDPVEPFQSRTEPAEEDVVVTDDDVEIADDDAMTDEAEEVEPDQDTGVQTYTLVQLVQVRITDIDEVGAIIDTALDSGANRVSSIRFEVEDRHEAVAQARERAVDEARDKAEHLADLTGVSLGPPLRVDESSPSGPPIGFDEYAMDADVAEDSAMARIEPGEQVITVTVYMTYGIE